MNSLQRSIEYIKPFFNQKTLKPLYFIFLLLTGGTFVFYFLKKAYSPVSDDFTILDSMYYAVISLTTVGYGDNLELLLLPEPGKKLGIIFTVLYLLIGYGVILWAFSAVIANFVEGSLSGLIKRREMLKKIQQLKDHYILCGSGRTGMTIVDELIKTNNKFVIIDLNQNDIEIIKSAFGEDNILYIIGDPTEEEILKQAGIEYASGLMCNLPEDKDNVFLTLTARALNKELKIVSNAYEPKSSSKLIRAGTNRVVLPIQIGALRLVSEMIRPSVVTFLDKMLRDNTNKRFSEIPLSEKSKYVGKKIIDSGIYEDTGLNIVAIYDEKLEGGFIYNPPASHVLNSKQKLIVIGDINQVNKLELLANPA